MNSEGQNPEYRNRQEISELLKQTLSKFQIKIEDLREKTITLNSTALELDNMQRLESEYGFFVTDLKDAKPDSADIMIDQFSFPGTMSGYDFAYLGDRMASLKPGGKYLMHHELQRLKVALSAHKVGEVLEEADFWRALAEIKKAILDQTEDKASSVDFKYDEVAFKRAVMKKNEKAVEIILAITKK